MALPAEKEVTAKDVKRLILKAYRDYKRGDLSESQVYRETFILGNLLKAIELTDLQERMEKIERALRDD